MMIFMVLIFIALASFLLYWQIHDNITPIIIKVCLAALVILSTMLIGTRIAEPALYESNKQLYNSLTYQLEYDIYDNNIDKAQLYEKVTNWNMDLAKGKVMQDNIWIGVFWHDYYDKFNFIEFS